VRPRSSRVPPRLARRWHRRRPRLRREKSQSRAAISSGYLSWGLRGAAGVVGILAGGLRAQPRVDHVRALQRLANFTDSYNQGFLIRHSSMWASSCSSG